MHRLLIFGATGLVGRQVLQISLADNSIQQVVAPTRRPLPADPKILNPAIDFESLPESAEWWNADAVICALGTTIRQARSQAQFRHVDHDYAMAVARLARRAGTPTFALVSSLGANPKSGNFYLRVKGEVERNLESVGFPSLTILRPSLLDGGPRPDKRLGESISIPLARLFAPLIPRRYRAITTLKVARALLTAATTARPGTHILESDELQSF
jgi:uncharacterized protein YbjT (DUF2867 family)